MSRHHLVLVSNALDDATRRTRSIDTDSPAASRKVFGLCQAVRTAGARPVVLSMGRGRADGSGRFFPATVKRVDGVLTVYAAFSHARLWSPWVSLVSLAWLMRALCRRRRGRGQCVVLFYNRLAAYLPALLLARASHCETRFDLEDGEVGLRGARFLLAKLLRWVYDASCGGGALLACSALAAHTRVVRTLCYYGTANSPALPARREGGALVVLLGGTLSDDTGVGIFIDALRHLQCQPPEVRRLLRFEITGQGPGLAAIADAVRDSQGPEVRLHGRTDLAGYEAVVAASHVGLALKPSTGLLADSTFPSKVIELAGAGLTVLTTDISDVLRVLAEGAVYLRPESGERLADLLVGLATDRSKAQAIARRGHQRVRDLCGPDNSGRLLVDFLFGAGS